MSGESENVLSNILDALEESAMEKELTNVYSFSEEELNDLIKRVYRRGFAHGLGTFAWFKNGTQFVGTCGVTLREALGDMESLAEYDPPIVQELT